MTTIDLPPTNALAAPMECASAAPNVTNGHEKRDTKVAPAAGDQDSTGSNGRLGTKVTRAVRGQATPPTNESSSPIGSTSAGPTLADPLIGMAADVLDDIERVRTANANRLRQLTDTSELGHGLTLDNPDVARLAALVAALQAAEDDAVKNLERIVRRHPLGKWAKGITGVGDKQLGRLLAVLRDPAWNDPGEAPRTFGQLVAYCGLDPVDGMARTHRRGAKSNWNEAARMRLRLIAAKVIMFAHSPYRPVYDEARDRYTDAVHVHACVRCGPKGKPAQPGSPLSAGHQHARALRLVMRVILRDLWAEAVRLHDLPPTRTATTPKQLSSAAPNSRRTGSFWHRDEPEDMPPTKSVPIIN